MPYYAMIGMSQGKLIICDNDEGDNAGEECLSVLEIWETVDDNAAKGG